MPGMRKKLKKLRDQTREAAERAEGAAIRAERAAAHTQRIVDSAGDPDARDSGGVTLGGPVGARIHTEPRSESD